MENEKVNNSSNEQTNDGDSNSNDSNSQGNESKESTPSFDAQLETSKLSQRIDTIIQRLTQLESNASNADSKPISNESENKDKEWKW